jgi:dipeptidyl-peptidase-3
VNKQLSAKYESLVNGAPELIKVLPWGKDFEVDVFRKPDFTALEVVSFATGGMNVFNSLTTINLTAPIYRHPCWY